MSTHVLSPSATLAGYDRWAATYDAAGNPLVAATAHVLGVAPLGVAGLDVLELGCGTGRHAAPILAEGARSYLGVDGSPGMLARARAAIAEPRARWLEADLTAPLPIPPASVDLALVVLVLEHLVDVAPLFASVAAALRPGGRLRIVEIHSDLVAAGTVAHFQDDDTELRFTSTAHAPDALVAALDRAGLSARRVHAWRADELVAVVPRLAKHAGRNVVLDVVSVRS